MIKAMMLGKKRKASIAAAMAFFLAVSCIQWPVMPVALAQSGNGDSQQVSSGNGQEQEEKQEDGSVSGSNALSVQTYGNEAKMTGDTQVSQLPCGQEEDNQDILYVSSGDYSLLCGNMTYYRLENGEKGELPLTEGLTKQSQKVVFSDDSGKEESCLIALDTTGPELGQTNILINQDAQDPTKRTIALTDVRDSGVGEVKLFYQAEGDSEKKEYPEAGLLHTECKEAREYIFFAEDYFGHETEYKVEIPGDTQAPELEITYDKDGGKASVKSGDVISLTDDASFVLEMTAEDDTSVYSSGLASFEIKRDGTEEAFLGENPDNTHYRQSASYEAGGADLEDGIYSYELNAADNAGNNAEPLCFTVMKDNENPKIQSVRLLVGGTQQTLGEDGYICSLQDYETEGNVQIEVTAGDNLALSHLIYSVDGEEEQTEPAPASPGNTADWKISVPKPEASGNLEIKLKVYDKSGRCAQQVISLKNDVKGPETACSWNQTGWSSEDVILRAEVTEEENGSGLDKLYYEIYRQGESTATEKGTVDLAVSEPAVKITREGNFEVRLYAQDQAGNVGDAVTKTVKIDKSSPAETVYVRYEAKDGFSLLKLFGKEELKITMYVQDQSSAADVIGKEDYSGIDCVTAKLGGKEVQLTPTKGVAALIDGSFKEESDGYQLSDLYEILEGTVTIGKNQQLEDTLKVTQIKDKAGNVRSQEDGIKIFLADNTQKEDDTVLVLDTTAPKLTNVDYCPQGSGKLWEGSYYYGSQAQIVLEIEEHFFEQGDSLKTELCIDGVWEDLDAQWEKSDEKADVYAAKITLPMVSEKETVYQIRLTYKDPSGNPLESEKYTVEEGVFLSQKMIVDGVNPALDSFEIRALAGEILLIDEKGYVPAYSGGSDIEVSFAITDSYFAEENLTVELYRTGEPKLVSSWKPELDLAYGTGDKVLCSFSFDGFSEAGGTEDGSYYFAVKYKDNGGNVIKLGEDFQAADDMVAGKLENGVYTMEKRLVIDHAKPVLTSITWNSPFQVTDARLATIERVADENSRLYYNSAVTVGIEIGEANLDIQDISVKLYRRQGPRDSFALERDMTLSQEKGVLYFSLSAGIDHLDDGEYRFVLSYTDKAGNVMELTKEPGQAEAFYEGAFDPLSGSYTSPVFVIDTIAPVVEAVYSDTAVENLGGTAFYDAPYQVSVRVQETNFRALELTEWVTEGGSGEWGIRLKRWKYDSQGEKQYAVLEELDAAANVAAYEPDYRADGSYELIIPIQEEGNYELGVTYIDLAGNKAREIPVRQTVYDTTPPEADVEYRAEDSGFLDFIRYGDMGYLFSKKKVVVSVMVRDEISGVKGLEGTFSCNDGGNPVTVKEIRETTPAQSFSHTFEFTIPMESDTACTGTLQASVYDFSGGRREFSRDCIMEGQSVSDSSSFGGITINTAPSRQVGGVNYYNAGIDRVSFTVNAREDYAGLRYVRITPRGGSFSMGSDAMPGAAANQSMDGSYQWNVKNNVNGTAGTADGGDGQPAGIIREPDISPTNGSGAEIIRNFTHTGYFPVGQENDRNDISVEMSAVSNTGYLRTAVSESFGIDVTAPTAEVTFNDIPVYNGKYYKDVRVATVTITERNFSSSDVVWEITNSEGTQPVISSFTNDNSTGNDNAVTHTATVTFEEDGDYTFGFRFTDYAGNTVEYSTESFTIDRTAPVIEVTYDNNESTNERYYSQPRTASIRITEHNFQASDVTVSVSAMDDGRELSAPSPGAFRDNGDEHTSSVYFDTDGEYTLDIQYTDLAGNEAAVFETQNFVVDLTEPELTISGVEPFSANKAEVMPVIEYSDTNLDGESVQITLTGYENGAVGYQRTETSIPNGRRIAYGDFAHEESIDDMYTLTVSLSDLAGHTTEQEIVFSVNRFGSTYQFDGDTRALLEKYYTNESKGLVITETNVDTLEFREIYLLLNGEKRELEEGRDYTVRETGDALGWKQYVYQLERNNFEEEGVYNVVIYSEDRAENASDNRIKDKTIEFVVDKTAPVVTIAGIEDERQYMAEERLVTIDVKDNMELDAMKIYLNSGSAAYQSYTKEEIVQAGGTVSVTIGSLNSRQSIVVSAVDRAGNVAEAQTSDFLITSNLFVQYYQNTPLFFGSVGALAALAVAASYFTLFRRKQKE